MKFAVEAWDPDYGTGGDASELDPSTDVVDADVEVPSSDWQPLEPVAARSLGTIFFVDGVRRIDARIWVSLDSGVVAGSCATVAAGAVACCGDRADVVRATVIRGVFTPEAEGVGPIRTRFGTYDHFPVRSGSPEDLYLGIHEEMTRIETETIPDSSDDDLIVFDGPLRGRTGPATLGLIKTQHVQYLDDAGQQVVTLLDPASRTPLFRIGARRFSRWSWYQRLPGPRTHDWAGIVRCELPGTAPLEEAAALADTATAVLPRFASEPHKESRAPQNLYPIKGLERELRRRLGDQRLLERALRTAAADAH